MISCVLGSGTRGCHLDTLVTGQPTKVTGWIRIALAPARNFVFPRRAAAATHHLRRAVGKAGAPSRSFTGSPQPPSRGHKPSRSDPATHHPHGAVRNEKGTNLREVTAATYHAHSNGKESVHTGRHPDGATQAPPVTRPPGRSKAGSQAPRTATNAKD